MAPGVRSMILTKVQLLRLFVVFIPSASSGCCGARLGLNTCQRECQKDCQIECQNIWQKECKNRCQIECQNRCQIECQKERQIDCQSIYARKNVRTYMSYLHPNNICQKLGQKKLPGWGSLWSKVILVVELSPYLSFLKSFPMFFRSLRESAWISSRTSL